MSSEDLVHMKPSQIRFTQDSIARRFKNGSLLNKAIQDILFGILSPDDFPPIRVIVLSGKQYSFDNRRLYVFRVCEFHGVVSEVRVKVVSITNLQEGRMTTLNDGVTIQVRQGGTKIHYKKPWLLNEDGKGNKNIPPTPKHTTSRPATNVLSHGTKQKRVNNPSHPSNGRCGQVDGMQRKTVHQSVRQKQTYAMTTPTNPCIVAKVNLPSSTSTHSTASDSDSCIKRKSSQSVSTNQPYCDSGLQDNSADNTGRRTSSQPPRPQIVSAIQPPPSSMLASGTRSLVDRLTPSSSSETTYDSEPKKRSRGFFSRILSFLCSLSSYARVFRFFLFYFLSSG